MNKKCDKDTILANVRRVAGQVSGIEKMIEDDRDIAEVLQQITASSSALKSIGKQVLEEYANGCFNNKAPLAQKDLQKLIVHLFKTV